MVVHVEISDTIPIPKEKLFSLMSDYNNWPKLFPSGHTSVKLIRKEGDLEYIELGDKRYRKVTETHRVIPPDRIDIEEFTPNWSGMFVNLFESSPEGGTRLTLKVDIKGGNFLFKLIEPFSKSYIRNRIRKEIHEDLKKSVRTTFS
ncbi:MAG TPA: SRPBCC family protein [Nitrososphaerales archaeon]|nr:SRPBCC family protein [Nitrososphaerales archaeon]